MSDQTRYNVKHTDTPTPAPWIVYERSDIGARAVACCFTETDAARIKLALTLLDQIESYKLRLAAKVGGEWYTLTHSGTQATLAEIVAINDEPGATKTNE